MTKSRNAACAITCPRALAANTADMRAFASALLSNDSKDRVDQILFALYTPGSSQEAVLCDRDLKIPVKFLPPAIVPNMGLEIRRAMQMMHKKAALVKPGCPQELLAAAAALPPGKVLLLV